MDLAMSFQAVDRAKPGRVRSRDLTSGNERMAASLQYLERKKLVQGQFEDGEIHYSQRDARLVEAVLHLGDMGISPGRIEAALRRFVSGGASSFSETVTELLTAHLYSLADIEALAKARRLLALGAIRALSLEIHEQEDQSVYCADPGNAARAA